MKNPYEILNIVASTIKYEERDILAQSFDDYAEQFITPANDEDIVEFILNTPNGDYIKAAEYFKMTQRQVISVIDKWITEIDKGLPLQRKSILMRSFPGGVN